MTEVTEFPGVFDAYPPEVYEPYEEVRVETPKLTRRARLSAKVKAAALITYQKTQPKVSTAGRFVANHEASAVGVVIISLLVNGKR